MYFIPKLTSLLLVSLGLSIQSYLANAGGVSLETVTDLCKETRECDVVPVWKFLLGNNFPDTESVVFLIFAYLVFVYQLNRYQLTKAVGYWKAHEERTGLSPPIELSSGGAVTANMSLKKLFSQHKYVQAMSFLVGGAVIWQLLSFLFGGMIVVPR
jgi:hypothetical protein